GAPSLAAGARGSLRDVRPLRERRAARGLVQHGGGSNGVRGRGGLHPERHRGFRDSGRDGVGGAVALDLGPRARDPAAAPRSRASGAARLGRPCEDPGVLVGAHGGSDRASARKTDGRAPSWRARDASGDAEMKPRETPWLFHGGRIPDAPRAAAAKRGGATSYREAVLVRGERIEAVGAPDRLRREAGRGARLVNLRGGTLTPG